MAPVLLTILSPAVAIVIALWGFRRSTRADKLRAFFEIQDRYLAGEVRAGRRTLHTLVSDLSIGEVAQLATADLSRVGYALAVMNSIAIACEAGYVERDLISRSMGRSFITAIQAARPYIDYLAERQGFRPYPYAEKLAAELGAAGSLPASSASVTSTTPAPQAAWKSADGSGSGESGSPIALGSGTA